MSKPEPSDAMNELANTAGIDPALLERDEVAVYLLDMARALQDLYGDPNPRAPLDFDPSWPDDDDEEAGN